MKSERIYIYIIYILLYFKFNGDSVISCSCKSAHGGKLYREKNTKRKCSPIKIDVVVEENIKHILTSIKAEREEYFTAENVTKVIRHEVFNFKACPTMFCVV